MKKLDLVESRVVFDNEHHTYTLDGRELSGVTPIVKWLFPDTYKGIPQSVLDKAAEYGTLIHSKCELYDNMGILPSDDDECRQVVVEYARLTKDYQVAKSEYLVSDEQDIASSIDKVFGDDSLGDIKTTSKVHMVNVQVQLSIYAWLYEMQTGRKANKLYLIWLPKPQYGTPMIKELERIPADVCSCIVEMYVKGGDQLNAMAVLSGYLMVTDEPKKRIEGEIPEAMDEIIYELITVKKQLDIFTEREKELKKMILDTMSIKGEDKWSSDLIQISRRAASERESIDTKALKANEPSIYESYKKVTKVAESLTYKIL